jgi:hypothetical protein
MGAWLNTEGEMGEPMMKKYNVAITTEMETALEKERKKRMLDSIPETIRYIVSEYLARN